MNFDPAGKAGRTGFEPAEPVSRFTDLANRRFRPLSHHPNIVAIAGFDAFKPRKSLDRLKNRLRVVSSAKIRLKSSLNCYTRMKPTHTR